MKKMLSKQETAERLGVSLRTIDALIARGQLPAYRVGPKLVRIDERELEAYVKLRAVAPTKKKTEPVVRPCRYVPGMKVV